MRGECLLTVYIWGQEAGIEMPESRAGETITRDTRRRYPLRRTEDGDDGDLAVVRQRAARQDITFDHSLWFWA